jgi:Do/DeqQ family serine protease
MLPDGSGQTPAFAGVDCKERDNMKKYLIPLLAAMISATPALAQQIPQSQAQMQTSFAPLVKRTAPAVVNIYTKRVVKERAVLNSPFANDPFFSQFFGRQMYAGPEQDRIERSLGSGVILDEKGTVATNHHVIKDAEEITVVTSDGREFAAKKILDDAKVDLAVLKIDPKGEKLSYLDLADSDAAQVGDLVLAIGNPFGLGQTVTSGIVSGLSRTSVGAGNDYGYFIQTDAAINPGNSGGALIDMQGRLLGINTAIFSTSGGSLGVGFAIPSSMLKTVVLASSHGGKLVHPWVGVGSQDVTPDMVESLGLKKAGGTLVSQVSPGSPADKAGLRQGDVILAVDGKEVQDAHAMKFRLATVPLGTPAKLTVWRAGKETELTLTTAAPPEIPPRDETLLKGRNPLSGAIVANISPAVQEEMGPLGQNKGVVVTKADAGTAARIGLRQGDIILSVNGEKIDSVSELRDILNGSAHGWRLQLMRGGQVLQMAITG